MEERRVPTTVTEVLEEITETARSILASLQDEGARGSLLEPKPQGNEMDHQVLAALVVGVAKIMAETNQILATLQLMQNLQGTGNPTPITKPAQTGGGEPTETTQEWLRKTLGPSSVGFFG